MKIFIELFLLFILWGNIWCVPSVIAGKRRKRDKPVYWRFFTGALMVELLLAVGCLQLFQRFNLTDIGIYAAPVIASMIGGFFYWRMANNKDRAGVFDALP